MPRSRHVSRMVENPNSPPTQRKHRHRRWPSKNSDVVYLTDSTADCTTTPPRGRSMETRDEGQRDAPLPGEDMASPTSSMSSSLDEDRSSSCSRSFRPPDAVYLPPPPPMMDHDDDGGCWKTFSGSSGGGSSSNNNKLKRLRGPRHHGRYSPRTTGRSHQSNRHRSLSRPRNSPKAATNAVGTSLRTGMRVISILSYLLMTSLVVILYILHNISFNIASSGGGYHPQLEPADLVQRQLSVSDVVKQQPLSNLRPASSGPGLLSTIASRFHPNTAAGNDEKESDVNDGVHLVGGVHITKPFSEITWEDLNFSVQTPQAPSCDAKLDAADIAFTLVTQVSEDRLWMLTEHCRRWSGPISAAVFTDRSAGDIHAELMNTNDPLYGTCKPNQVRIDTVPKADIPRGEYPVNVLRNVAMRGVSTSHVFYADIDFWESKNLYNMLHSKFIRQQLASDPKLALVVPAFQIARQCKEVRDCRAENMEKMPHTKKELIKMVMERKASAFDPTNRGGHGSTSYSDWFRMEEGDMWDIPCITSNRYEPYLAMRYCQDLPPYQEVFTGYGKNKMTQIMQMRHTGYAFSQIGGVFVVHYPHLSSKERATWNKGKKQRDKLLKKKKTTDWTQYKRGRVDKLFVEFRKWLNEKVENRERIPMCEDALDDDKKLWI